tara:strand:+ start:163 stop:1236 length:1074 start_codon:yes stop_codon:yes gene_type:complete
MNSLAIYAGPSALERIENEGLNSKHFKLMVGASGGPKWFVLFGLDRYLFGNFFANRNEPLYTIGSSVGAWRLCCLAASDPVGCIRRLAHYYCHEDYSNMTSAKEVTQSARVMLEKILVDDIKIQVIDNKIFRTHIVAARSKGISSSASSVAHAFHLGLSAICNLFTRRSLRHFFDRSIFTSDTDTSPWSSSFSVDSISRLTEENLTEVLLASGSIPFVLEGVNNIPGSDPGRYWDGGILDYHFDWPFLDSKDDLVLYPHYSPQLIPGWFDKALPWRRVNDSALDKVVLLTPTTAFVKNLPGGKIPDRNDFKRLSFDKRVKVWEEVMTRSEELAMEFDELLTRKDIPSFIIPIKERMR